MQFFGTIVGRELSAFLEKHETVLERRYNLFITQSFNKSVFDF